MLLFAVSLRLRKEGRHLEGVYPRGPRALRRRARRGQEEVQDAIRGHGTYGYMSPFSPFSSICFNI